MTDRGRIYDLADEVCNLSIKAIDKITKLKQENNKLKQRIAELEKPKKKRKFRAMTNGEYCTYRKTGCNGCEYRQSLTYYDYYCDYSNFNKVNQERDENKPYKTKDGKYILIEVEE